MRRPSRVLHGPTDSCVPPRVKPPTVRLTATTARADRAQGQGHLGMSAISTHPDISRPARAALTEPPFGTARSRAGWRVALYGIAALLLGWSIAPYAITAIDAASHHRDFFGVAGYYPMDGDQYLAWIRSGGHGLIRNMYGMTTAGAVFVHPMFSLSGLAERYLGIGPAVLMAFWKLVSVAVLFAGCVRLVTRYVPGDAVAARVVALLLALFGGLTPLALAIGGIDGSGSLDMARAAGDLIPAMATWDYSPLAICVGLMPFAIEGLQRIIDGSATPRVVTGTAMLGLMISWLHPWQGETVLLTAGLLLVLRAIHQRGRIGAGGEASLIRHLRPSRGLLVVGCATVAPIVYYLLLSRLDPGWTASEQNSVWQAVINQSVILTCVLPLILLGLWVSYLRRHDPSVWALVTWLTATMLVVVISPTGEYHAIDGIMLPVAVLVGCQLASTRDLRPIRRGLLTAVVLAAMTVPLVVFASGAVPHMLSPAITSYTEVAPADVAAAHAASDVAHGRLILTTRQLGTVIPALDDATTWVGHPIWTPNYIARAIASVELFGGHLSARRALRFVRRTAPVVLAPCGTAPRLRLLAAGGYRKRQIGCATIFWRPMAQSRQDSVSAPGAGH